MSLKKIQKIYLADTDATGFVYYARYLEWMEAARLDLLEESGTNLNELKKSQIGALVKNVSCNYNAPLKLGDEVETETYLSKFGKTNLTVSYNFKNLTEQTDAGTGEVLIVFINTETLRPIRIPENIIESFKKHYIAPSE